MGHVSFGGPRTVLPFGGHFQPALVWEMSVGPRGAPPPPFLHTTLALESQRASAGPGAEGDEDIATAYSVVMKALITKGDARAASAAFDEMLLAGYPPSYVLAHIRLFFPFAYVGLIP